MGQAGSGGCDVSTFHNVGMVPEFYHEAAIYYKGGISMKHLRLLLIAFLVLLPALCQGAGYGYPINLIWNSLGNGTGPDRVAQRAQPLRQTVQLRPGDRVLLYSDGAESLIGQSTTSENFLFSDELLAIKDAPIADIVDRLTDLANHRQINPAEVDDLTLVGLEIR